MRKLCAFLQEAQRRAIARIAGTAIDDNFSG
jgi:hypothetical protein